MVRWGETFWGEGNRGFEVLSTNVKNGGIAIDEFQRFLTESLQGETTYCSKLTRLQSQLLKVQHVGTFTPIWHSIRDLLEKISQAHATTVSFYQDLLRDIHLYQDAYQKKVKSSINKDPDIARTAELISQLNTTFNNVNKAKEQYHSIGLDYERAKRVGSNLSNGTSTPVPGDNPSSSSLAQSALNSLTSSSRQIERLEKKYRQSHDDYRSSIEKYNAIRSEFEKRFYDACNKFQDFEADHVEKMLIFALNYSDILQRTNEQTRQAQHEFREKLKVFTGADLIDAFVEQKRTGSERPMAIQFEELDHLKTSLHLTNSSITPDSTGVTQADELIIFDPPETTALPSFQAHFPVSSPTMSSAWPSTSSMKKSDSNRGLASSTSVGYLQNNNQSMSPSSFNPTTMSLSDPNNPLARLQGASTDQTSNPFDLKIRRPVLKGLWPSNRKEKKEKKNEKKTSTNSKTLKPTTNPQAMATSIIDEQNFPSSNLDETNEFHRMMGSIDGINQIPNLTKSKCPTPEPYTQSSPSLPASSTYRPGCQSTIPFSSSAMRKSSSSSDSSDDDDDDYPISKIQFKINPTGQKASTIVEENDEAKISNAMRLVDKNIGHFATYSRSTRPKIADMSKSISSGRIPPPLPSRPTSTLSTSFTTDNFGQTGSLTNTNDAFDPRPKSMTVSSAHQENIPPVPPSRPMTSESRKPISTPSIDDDNEVANTTNSRSIRTRQTMSSRSATTKKILHLRSTLIERIRSIWKVSSKRSPIVFRRLTLVRKLSGGFSTDLIDENSSLQTFYTARESFSFESNSSFVFQQPTMSNAAPSIANGRMTPFIAPTSQSFANGLINSIDQRFSPLTIGGSDQIPIAVAFQETIHVMMSGDDQSKWKIRILGDMLVSFPAAILNLLVDPSPHLNPLEFRLQNLNKVENVIANTQLVTQNASNTESDSPIYSFNMSSLSQTLKNLQEKNRSLPFFNFGILKYEVKHAGVSSIPIEVSSTWSRTSEMISLQISYRFKSSTLPESIRIVNDVVMFSTTISDGNELVRSSPMAEWSTNDRKLSWKVPYIFDGTGTLTAIIKPCQTSIDDQPISTTRTSTTSPIVHVQFFGENALFSSIDFEFACRGYRISLLKKKISSGKYQSEGEQNETIEMFRRPSVDQHRLSLSSPLVA